VLAATPQRTARDAAEREREMSDPNAWDAFMAGASTHTHAERKWKASASCGNAPACRGASLSH